MHASSSQVHLVFSLSCLLFSRFSFSVPVMVITELGGIHRVVVEVVDCRLWKSVLATWVSKIVLWAFVLFFPFIIETDGYRAHRKVELYISVSRSSFSFLVSCFLFPVSRFSFLFIGASFPLQLMMRWLNP